MQDKKDFDGLRNVYAETSRYIVAQTGEEKGIIRSVQNGIFFTRDKQIHAGKVPSKECLHCGLADGMQHRVWECEAFEDLRALTPHQDYEFLQSQPESTRYHTWFVESRDDFHWRQALHGIPSRAAVTHDPPGDEVLHLFSDGGDVCTPPDPVVELQVGPFVLLRCLMEDFCQGTVAS